MNSYALIAFATPVVVVLLGWAAVALHRRSLRRIHDAEVRGAAPKAM
jgi:hypothetical protein